MQGTHTQIERDRNRERERESVGKKLISFKFDGIFWKNLSNQCGCVLSEGIWDKILNY
jgi:hypothetical protein